MRREGLVSRSRPTATSSFRAAPCRPREVSTQDPRTFLLYEQYVDAGAYDTHKATAHFHEHVVGRAVPFLESREVATYETI
jgi:quinol monooxygenase YgiN